MSAVTDAPCAPWTPTFCIDLGSLDPAVQAATGLGVQVASDLLWSLSGRRYGVCEATIRPCRHSCWPDRGWGWWNNATGWWGWPYPVNLGGGIWINCGCGSCGDTCSCTPLQEVVLPYPVVDITQIMIDGVVLDPSKYVVYDHRIVVRVDGGSWPQCFPAGTLVTTAQGQVPIEDVEIGDMVLTHRGRWRAVTRSGMTGIRETVTVQAHGPLTATADHPVWSREMGYVGNQRKFGEPEWTPASSLVSRYVATPRSVPACEPVLPEGQKDSPEFWKFVGFWVGDGWTTEQGRIRICVKKQRKRDYLDMLIPDWHCTSEADGKVRYGCTDRALAGYLREQFGAGAYGKRIPTWLLGAPERVRQDFLDGYVNSDDGTVTVEGEIRIVTMSKAAAIALKLLVNSLGITASAYQHSTNQSWHVAWRPGPRLKPHSVTDDRAHWIRVRSVSEGTDRVPVFDLAVDEDESFVADGFVVHNCNDLSKTTGTGAWHISATYGVSVPPSGALAVGQLAIEIAKDCAGQACALPRNVTSITRQGVSQTFSNVRGNLVFGLALVDAFLAAHNPAGVSGRAQIFDIDGPRPRAKTSP